jgi:hypothetical protein
MKITFERRFFQLRLVNNCLFYAQPYQLSYSFPLRENNRYKHYGQDIIL